MGTDVSGILISIVIVSWNTRDLLCACLRSVGAASHHAGGRVEVIVIDNASSDGSVEAVRTQFPAFRVLANTTNVGFSAATNQGIRASVGRNILLLNPDTELQPTSLLLLLRAMEAKPATAAVAPRLVHADGRLQVSCFPLPTLGREFSRLFHLDAITALSEYPMRQWSLQAPRQVQAAQGACLLVRRDVLEQVGLLDESFFIYSEEIDLCRRMNSAGWELYWVPTSVVVHHGGQSTRQVASRMFLELYRSKVEYFRKHFGVNGARSYKLLLLAAALPRVFAAPVAALLTPARRRELLGIARNYRALVSALPAL